VSSELVEGVMKRAAGRMRSSRRFLIAAMTVVFGLFVPMRPAEDRLAGQAPCHVTLENGEVQGNSLGETCAFWGIPFAASTAANNRWKPPQARPAWHPLVFDATTAKTTTCAASEDCLWLNVWVRNPPETALAPVLVWLHTGAFTAGSANFPATVGARLAAETGTVVVAPNYRLGPFGFLAHSALSAEDPEGSSGNYGLLDQQAALRWVRNNIAQFGGDPDNVTIAGTSAGGQSVGLQLVSPASGGLFHRAIMQSAYPTSRWASKVEAQAQGNAFAAALQCNDPAQVLTCMRSAPRAAVLAALPLASLQVVESPGRVFWEPSVDGIVIPDQPRVQFDAGAFHRVPTIVGLNRDEGWGSFVSPFVGLSFPSGVSATQYEDWVNDEFGPHAPGVLDLYPAGPSPASMLAQLVGDVQFACETRRVARAIEQTGTPVYLYSYEYVIPGFLGNRVLHGVESNIIFGNDYVPPVFPSHPLTDPDNALHNKMATYWAQFAATGSPNRGDTSLESWPPFTRPAGPGRGTDKYLVFDTALREGTRLREAQCNFFEPFYFRPVLGSVPAATP
jgi:para-nitrobenzyl esterase